MLYVGLSVTDACTCHIRHWNVSILFNCNIPNRLYVCFVHWTAPFSWLSNSLPDGTKCPCSKKQRSTNYIQVKKWSSLSSFLVLFPKWGNLERNSFKRTERRQKLEVLFSEYNWYWRFVGEQFILNATANRSCRFKKKIVFCHIILLDKFERIDGESPKPINHNNNKMDISLALHFPFAYSIQF